MENFAASLLAERRPVTWLFAGDSITEGAVHTRGWRDYTQLFKERLIELKRNEDVVINTAVGGWFVQNLLPRVDERIVHFQPDAVFLMFGTNDAHSAEDGIERYARTYSQVVEQLRSAGIESICIQTTVPMAPIDPEETVAMSQVADEKTRRAKLAGLRLRLKWIPPYIDATRNMATKLEVPLIDHYRVWESVNGQRGPLLDGGFHPNEYGHRLIARTIFKQLGIWDDKSWTCRLFIPADLAD